MTVLTLTYAILLPTLTGFIFVSYFSMSDRRKNLFENLFLGYGIGMGIITFEMFILGLSGLRLSLILVSSVQVVILIILLYFVFRSGVNFSKVIGLNPPTPPLKKGGEEEFGEGFSGKKKLNLRLVFISIIGAWIILKSLFVIYQNSIWPIVEWDSWSTWSSAAKFFFYEKGFVLDIKDENFFATGYRDSYPSYPLHVPLMQVWFSLCIGQPHETYMKIWNSFYFISIIGLVFFTVKRESSLFIALLTSLFLSSAPLLTSHAISAYADMPLSYYSLAAMVCFWRYMSSTGEGPKDSNGLLLLTGTSIVFSMWTKIEGLFFVVAFAIALLLFLISKERSFKKFILYLAPIVIIMGIWFIFFNIKDVRLGYLRKDVFVKGFHFDVLSVAWNEIMFSANFNIVFMFLMVMFLVGFKKIIQSNLKYLFITLFSLIAIFLFVYIKTRYHQWIWYMIDRNILTFTPIMYFMSALTATEILKSARDFNKLSVKKVPSGIRWL